MAKHVKEMDTLKEHLGKHQLKLPQQMALNPTSVGT